MDKHILDYVAGSRIDGSYVITNGQYGYNSQKIYITKNYRDQRLDKKNKAYYEKINKLKSKLSLLNPGDKKYAQYQAQIEELNGKLWKISSLDDIGDKKVRILMMTLSSKKADAPVNIYYSHTIMNYKREPVCGPVSQTTVNLNEADKVYLDEIYNLDNLQYIHKIFIADYNSSCLVAKQSFQERIVYLSTNNDGMAYTHHYGIPSKLKKVLEEDLQLPAN